jgi:hypothetical protein
VTINTTAGLREAGLDVHDITAGNRSQCRRLTALACGVRSPA